MFNDIDFAIRQE